MNFRAAVSLASLALLSLPWREAKSGCVTDQLAPRGMTSPSRVGAVATPMERHMTMLEAGFAQGSGLETMRE
jgi:hypothetical protein